MLEGAVPGNRRKSCAHWVEVESESKTSKYIAIPAYIINF